MEECPDAPYYMEPFEVITVDEGLFQGQLDKIQEAVLSFNREHPKHGAPTITPTYDKYEGSEGKWAAEYHLAIHADPTKWPRLPTYAKYVEARRCHANRATS